MTTLLRSLTGPGLLALGLFMACSSASKYDDDDDNAGNSGQSGSSGAKGGSAGASAGHAGKGSDAQGGTGGSVGGEAGATGSGGSTGATGGNAGEGAQSGGGESGTATGSTGDASFGGDGSSTGGSSSGGSASGGKGGTGGTTGGVGGTTGGSGGTAGAGAGSGGSAGAACSTISIEPLSHHLGDGDGSEGSTFTRSFSVTCSCDHPYLSFQIDGPNREKAPKISLNGQQLSSLASFYPAVTSADVWQSNSDGSYDYNGYLQIHYDVSGKLTSGTNSFNITNGTVADDYNFQDVRIECGAPVDPIGPDIVNRGAWVGYVAAKSGDDPLGIQGAFYAYGDGATCTLPSNLCSSGACCLSGTTLATDPATNWGCGMGLSLHNTGGSSPMDLAYSGAASCFALELTGNSGDNELRLQAATYADMTGRTAPVYSLGTLNGTEWKSVCFSDFACPASPATPCSVTGSWYKLELNVVGGKQAGVFNVCLRSLIPYAP